MVQDAAGSDGKSLLASRLDFVVLAANGDGSEDGNSTRGAAATSARGSAAERGTMKALSSILTSLARRDMTYVSYKASLLTALLMPVLGVHSRVSVLALVNPTADNFDESVRVCPRVFKYCYPRGRRSDECALCTDAPPAP